MKIINRPISTKIIINSKAVVGIPLSISQLTTGKDGQKSFTGKWSWNFGDGTSREDFTNPETFTHTFLYPGEYVIILNFRETVFSQTPDATNRINLTVISPNVVISNLYHDEKGGIELSNTSGIDMDLSGWKLISGNTSFTFPVNTIILSGKKLVLSGRTLGIQNELHVSVSLLYPDNTLASIYPKTQVLQVVKPVTFKQQKKEVVVVQDIILQKEEKIVEEIISEQVAIKNLSASVVLASEKIDKINQKNLPWLWWAFGGVLLTGSIGIMAIRKYSRKKQGVSALADEFEIVE